MAFLDTIKARTGTLCYVRLEKEAEREVALAMQLPLKDSNHQELFYSPRSLLGEFRTECEQFETVGLKVLPTDVVDILFKCKLLFAAQTEHEYNQRRGSVSLFDNFATVPNWQDRNEKAEVLIDRYITNLEAEIHERTLITHINSFSCARRHEDPQNLFENLFATLGFPFLCFFEGNHLIEKHRKREPGLKSYDQADATRFFCAPSVGFPALGSLAYCRSYSSMWLRTFLNMLRIASYIHPGQRDFGRDVKMTAPKFPVFLGTHSEGCFSWHEDEKESWAKIPDGCLFLSFGYRGLSNMWLDFRTLPAIKKFMIDHRKIFDYLKNPWNTRNINDIAPALDILSSATQIPDLGAKILLIYCCLEHLFVPKGANTENNKYIIGGMNALGPQLLPWFSNLYNLRCTYAHKGFVLKDEKTMSLVADSMKNVMTLLASKLSIA